MIRTVFLPFAAVLALASGSPAAQGVSARGPLPGADARPPASHVRRTPLGTLPLIADQCGLGPLERDSSVGGAGAGDGGPLTINGRVFSRGFGTASTSWITVDLLGVAERFSTWVGIDDEVGNAGSAVFQVIADGVLLFDSGVRTGADPALFSGPLNVTGVRELQLLVLDAGDGSLGDHADWGQPVLTSAVSSRPGGRGALFRYLRGEWEDPIDWPLLPIHASLLSEGRLLTHASYSATAAGSDSTADPHDRTRADVARIADWSHITLDHPSEEVYASGHVRRADGQLLVLGGHAGRDGTARPFGRVQVSLFDQTRLLWSPRKAMPVERWGPSALTVGNGDVLSIGGAHAGGTPSDPVVFDGLAWRSLTDVDTSSWWSAGSARYDDVYPFLHLASDGRVWVTGWGEDLHAIDVRGRGSSRTFSREAFGRVFGAAAPSGPDQVLIASGVDSAASSNAASKTCVHVDFSSSLPSVSPTGSLLFERADAAATVLADGSVFVHGGSRVHANETTAPADSYVRVPEIWHPASGSWSLATPSKHPRGFRSTSVLLPDGRVWTGGGECGPGCSSGLVAEVFRPPYLFTPASRGKLAPRPVIASAPALVEYDVPFTVAMGNADTIQRVTLLRYGSSTHGVDFEQRFLELTFNQTADLLQVAPPVDGNAAPPGPYLLFAFRGGVPSVAATIQLDQPSPGAWELLTTSDSSTLEPRHETAMVSLGGKLYLIGGRGSRPVQEYDPITSTWTDLGNPPLQMHHFQPLVYEGRIWIVGAFEGGYPNETPVPTLWIYDPLADTWTQGPAIPPARNRGSAGAVVYEDKFYLVGGNTLGHNGGAVPWLDVFDPATQTWTALPDAPNARDHFLAAVVGNKLVAAGGRTTDLPNPFDKTVPEVDVYDFTANAWTTASNDIPTERAGTMAAPVEGFVVVAGGESNSMTEAHAQVEAFEVATEDWAALPPLQQDRHSGGVAVHDGRLWVASGSGRRGGSPELDTFETLNVRPLLEAVSTNVLSNGDFAKGDDSWSGSASPTLVAPGGVNEPAVRFSNGDLTQTVSVSPGTTYRLTALYKASGTSGAATATVLYLDTGGAVVGSETDTLTNAGAWTSLRIEGAAPASAASARVRFLAGGNRELVLDDVALSSR